MSNIVTIAGSPSAASRSATVLAYARATLERAGFSVETIDIRQLPAEALLWGQADHAAIRHSHDLIRQAAGVIIATPIYKAAYSGLLKAFLDLLPSNALDSKIILPIATGGSLAHFLALDYALRPVLAALGASHILKGVYLLDSEVQWQDNQLHFENGSQDRLQGVIHTLIAEVRREPGLIVTQQ